MSKPNPDRQGTRRRILVINDTKEILELFRDVLEGEMGHDVTLMSFAPDELTRVTELNPDLVIVDFVMGERELDGWQLIQKMRMNPATAGIPIVACTAAVRQVRESEAYLLEQGVQVVLKPFSVAQLEEAVVRALQMGDSSEGLRTNAALSRSRATGDEGRDSEPQST
jgi:CheY-like chemotaxis protein